MSDIIHDTKLKHDGGEHNLEVELDGEQAIIRFGSSFTLRLDESGVNQLTDILEDTLGCIRHLRRKSEAQWELSSEAEMIQAGIDAREKVKAQRLAGRS